MTKPPKTDEKILINSVKKSIESGDYVILPHARVRCVERDISAADIELALERGKRVKMRDRFDQELKRWSYAYEGNGVDGDPLRIIITFIQKLAVVTVVNLRGNK